LRVLGNDVGLIGPNGCGLGQCGACAAIVGGKLTRTCSIALRDVGEDKSPHSRHWVPWRSFTLCGDRFEEQAAQCGYCSNGMIMVAKLLLDRNPNPTDDEIKSALADQLCRCGVHDRVVHAVRRAAVEAAR
jgi:nicotinate dehydrogenase subunit A